MNLRDYERWLIEHWDGYRLDEILIDSEPVTPKFESIDVLNIIHALRSLSILTSGLCGEAGEASEHFKKWIRDGRINKVAAAIELGDVLAYLTWLTAALGYTLEDIAGLNRDKLVARGQAGVGFRDKALT